MSGQFRSLHSGRLLFWVLLPALFTFIAEEIIVVRWWAYVVPVLIGLIGLLLFHDILRSEPNRPLSRDDVFKIISMSGAAIVAIALTGAFFQSTRQEQERLYKQALLEQCTLSLRYWLILPKIILGTSDRTVIKRSGSSSLARSLFSKARKLVTPWSSLGP